MACTPATFENITGATKPSKDEAINPHSLGPLDKSDALKAPRPISPISVSWVNTLRPRFRWELRPGETGAIVELSRKRDDFSSSDVRHFKGVGTELVAPEDLPAGMWFWRLRGRNEAAEGELEATSPVWQVLVRGPSRSGESSDTPQGSIYDVNGDGIPDISFMSVVRPEFFPPDPGLPKTPIPLLFTALADGNGMFQPADIARRFFADTIHVDAPFTGGTDIDGDGFADFAVADLYPSEDPTYPDEPAIFVYHGATAGEDDDKDRQLGYVSTPYIATTPSIQLVGDVNGDGYGDLSVAGAESSFTALGSNTSLSRAALLMFPFNSAAEGSTGPQPWRVLAGACDLDGDGRSEIAIASTAPKSPITLAKGTSTFFDPFTFMSVSSDLPSPVKAMAITSGDFEGTAKPEFAFTTTLGGLPAICVYRNDALSKQTCWKSAEALPGFGAGLAAADVDKDGADEILFTSDKGVGMLRRTAPDQFDAMKWIATGAFGPGITVLHPGRPEPARWAAATKDGTKLRIFEGDVEKQTIDIADYKGMASIGPSLR